MPRGHRPPSSAASISPPRISPVMFFRHFLMMLALSAAGIWASRRRATYRIVVHGCDGLFGWLTHSNPATMYSLPADRTPHRRIKLIPSCRAYMSLCSSASCWPPSLILTSWRSTTCRPACSCTIGFSQLDSRRVIILFIPCDELVFRARQQAALTRMSRRRQRKVVARAVSSGVRGSRHVMTCRHSS